MMVFWGILLYHLYRDYSTISEHKAPISLKTAIKNYNKENSTKIFDATKDALL